jgi:hypothetical protein
VSKKSLAHEEAADRRVELERIHEKMAVRLHEYPQTWGGMGALLGSARERPGAGWTRSYAAGWEATFGKPAPAPPYAWPRPARGEDDRIPPALRLLEVAVPMWIEQFRPMPWDERMKVRDECLVGLGIATDDPDGLGGVANLVCGSTGKPGQVAKSFNAIARGLALGALQPGGVTFAGMHFEAT